MRQSLLKCHMYELSVFVQLSLSPLSLSSGVRLPLVLVHALGRYHWRLHYLQACYLIIQTTYDSKYFLYLCVQSHPFLMQTVNTNFFRIVPVCVPSVRKWGAYNMATIIDKFDFKFANRVTISFFFKIRWPCFFRRVAVVRRGRGRRRCWEGVDD